MHSIGLRTLEALINVAFLKISVSNDPYNIPYKGNEGN